MCAAKRKSISPPQGDIKLWKGTRWFIEGDISQYFDTIDHKILLEILARNIHDGRFIRLISNMLEAGYLEEWKFNQTISGVPQGGVISPILANIYLNEFDNWIEEVLIPKYTKGERQKGNDAIGVDEETQEAEPERKLADRPAERTSLKGKLSEMKARVSGTPAGRDAVDKAKGKEEVI